MYKLMLDNITQFCKSISYKDSFKVNLILHPSVSFCYYSVAVINHHDKRQLKEKKMLVLAYGFRGLTSNHGREAWQEE